MATQRQRKAAEKVVENGGNVSRAMRDAGYTPQTAKTPQKLTESKGWQELMDEYLPDLDIARAHHELLQATSVAHMVFPLNVTDEEITDLLAEVGCRTRKFMHSESQTHVWYWVADSASRKAAVEMAYKLKGRLLSKVDLTSDGQGLFSAGKLEIRIAPPVDHDQRDAEPRTDAA